MPHPPRRSALALALLVPAPTLGVIAAMWVWPNAFGKSLYFAAKLWIVALPVGWHLLVDRAPLSWSPARSRDLWLGAALGLAMGAVIVGSWWVVRPFVDPASVRDAVTGMGLDARWRFALAGAGWTLVNSLVEEIVWRWFVTSRWLRVVPKWPAILLAAACFTLHHVAALASYTSLPITALASAGVLAAGAVWSWLWIRTRSIWPAWIAHVAADAAIFGLGYHIVFG